MRIGGSNFDRYELSKLLPVQVREFDGKRVAQTRTGTFVRITLADGRDYAIFFTLSKTGAARCEMFVMSAYPLERSKKSVAVTGEMKFNVAVAMVLSGKKPKFPPGRFQNDKKSPKALFDGSGNLLFISPYAWTLAGGGRCLSQSGNPFVILWGVGRKMQGDHIPGMP